MTPAELLADKDHVLVDFDGPVCTVFATLTSRTVANRLKTLLGTELPPALATSDDPFDVLRYASTIGSGTAHAVEVQLRRCEAEAVVTARPTPGADGSLRALAAQGFTLTVVSNNGTDAVRTYLTLHDMSNVVRRISARTRSDLAELKPAPYLLQQAIQSLGTAPDRCVMVGDSVSDIEAAHVAGMAAIAYANKPFKLQRFQGHNADVIIGDMAELSTASAAG